MPVLAFDMTTANHESRRFEFRGENKTEYYEGDLKPLSTRDIDMRIEKSSAGEYAIYKEVSRSGLAFRRSWAHIRKDKTNLTVFWFLRRGQMMISHPGGRYFVHPEECAITQSSRAFYMELTPEPGGVMEVIHVVVPSYKLYSIISDNLDFGQAFPTSRGDLFLAEKIFELLFERDDQVDEETSEQLVETLLTGVGKMIGQMAGVPSKRCSIADRRVSDITRYINQHFANPDLNAKMVADSCGISLRYLCHILKKNDLSFSNLVWGKRMETAHDWLQDAKMEPYSISEIAYLVGFKSSAHFSRMFKTRYGVAPREFRATHAAEAEEAAETQPAE